MSYPTLSSKWSLSFLQAIAHDAFRALINLSDSQLLEGALSESLFLQFLVSYIIVSIIKSPIVRSSHHTLTEPYLNTC